ncbi:MAG: amidohydrolase family protein [Pseudonocardiaceae bacterium]
MASRRLWRWLRRLVLYPFLALVLAIVGGVTFYELTLYRSSPAHDGVLALTGATVLVGPGLEPVAGATVLVEDGVITQVGTEVAVPPDAQTIDLAGHTILPGLIDSHIHFAAPERERGQDPGVLTVPRLVVDWVRAFPAYRRDFLAHGVTSVRSMGDEYPWINDVRRSVAEGEFEGPRFFVAGPLFGTRGGHPVVTIGVDPESGTVRIPESPTQARQMVRELVTGDDPVDLIKVVQERGDPTRLALEPIDPQILQAIVAEAHSHGVRVFAHWGTFEDLRGVLAAGVDGLDHLEPRGAGHGWPDGVMETIIERGITLAPTLAVTEVALPADVHSDLRDRLREFHEAGGRVIAGSDTGVPGMFSGAGLIRELELLVDAGLSPQEALIAATSTAAEALRADHVGTISPGRAADLLIIEGDPLANITAVRSVQLVLRDGRIVVDNR